MDLSTWEALGKPPCWIQESSFKDGDKTLHVFFDEGYGSIKLEIFSPNGTIEHESPTGIIIEENYLLLGPSYTGKKSQLYKLMKPLTTYDL